MKARLTGLAMVSVLTASLFAQDGLFINGKFKIEGGDFRGSSIVVEKNGNKEKTIPVTGGTFSFPLAFNSQYILSFEKDGFVTKKLSFDTHAPSEGIEDGFHPFDFTISLFKQYDDVNIVVFNQPVGVIKYYEEIDDFDYDTDYTKSIQSRLQAAMDAIEKAKEEEAQREELSEKEARNADDAKAKAELKANKQAEAEEKARTEKEAKLAKVQEEEERKRLAAAQQEEDKRRKALARKDEEERKRAEALARLAKLKKEVASLHDGTDGRTETTTNEGFEESPVRGAKTVEHDEEPVLPPVQEPDVSRNEELVVEDNKVITKVTLDDGSLATEYQKIVHKFGATYYFRNGQSISQQIYESEALAEN